MEFDARVRLAIYEHTIRHTRVPLIREIAAQIEASEAAVREACLRLYAGRTGIVPHAASGELLFAAPFSAAPSSFQVGVNGRRWFAPCGWDAFGIVQILGGTGVVHTSCPCCGEPFRVSVTNYTLDDARGWMNLVVPAQRFWEDIVFT